MRILSIATGVIGILVGILCIANSGLLFMNIAFLVGLAMLFTGAIALCAYMFGIGETRTEAMWFLSESILVILLGVLILANRVTTDLAVPYVFGTWLMTSGILRIVLGLTRRNEMDSFEFRANSVMGGIGLIFGVYFYLNTLMFNLTVAVLVGIAMIVHGLDMVIFGMGMPQSHTLRRAIRKREEEEPVEDFFLFDDRDNPNA